MYHWSVMAKATALAPSVVAFPLPPSRDTDGLSLHHDDYGVHRSLMSA
jgi:hypothetical protein